VVVLFGRLTLFGVYNRAGCTLDAHSASTGKGEPNALSKNSTQYEGGGTSRRGAISKLDNLLRRGAYCEFSRVRPWRTGRIRELCYVSELRFRLTAAARLSH